MKPHEINGKSDPDPRRAPGGFRAGAGRPTRAEVRGLEKAKIRLERYLARKIGKIGKTYFALAAGEVVETEKGAIKLAVDPPTTRHAIERLLPAARQEIDLSVGLKIIRVNAFLPDGEDTTP